MSTSSTATAVQTVVCGHTFSISSRFAMNDSRILGRGSYGVVATALDTQIGSQVAIKRIRPYGQDEWDGRHTLREIRLMKLLGNHPNIITLYELSLFESKMELYMVMELMDCDLHHIISSKQPLGDLHFKCFTKQLLEGIKAMHDVGVFHRDLKPGNILVSRDCKLRITDFGLARYMDEITLSGYNTQNPMTEYVVTRWYRCPELLLAPNKPYSKAIDLWSVGCIIAEMLRRKPLFQGKGHTHQVQLIFEVFGYDGPQRLGFEISEETEAFLSKKCRFRPQDLRQFLPPDANEDAIDLVDALLTVNPRLRVTAAQALRAPYLQDAECFYDYEFKYIPQPPPKYFDFENAKCSAEELKQLIEDEVSFGGSIGAEDYYCASQMELPSQSEIEMAGLKSQQQHDQGMRIASKQDVTFLPQEKVLSRTAEHTEYDNYKPDVPVKINSSVGATEPDAILEALVMVAESDPSGSVLTPSRRAAKLAEQARIDAIAAKGARARARILAQQQQQLLESQQQPNVEALAPSKPSTNPFAHKSARRHSLLGNVPSNAPAKVSETSGVQSLFNSFSLLNTSDKVEKKEGSTKSTILPRFLGQKSRRSPDLLEESETERIVRSEPGDMTRRSVHDFRTEASLKSRKLAETDVDRSSSLPVIVSRTKGVL